MKITKTLFKTEIEFQPRELNDLYHGIPVHMSVGLLIWIKKVFGLDMLVPLEEKVNNK